jgi:hypothetical protein
VAITGCRISGYSGDPTGASPNIRAPSLTGTTFGELLAS